MFTRSHSDIHMLKSKFIMGVSSREDLKLAMEYIGALEALAEEASRTGIYGNKGWESRMGWKGD